MNLKISFKTGKKPKDILFLKYKNELINFDKIKKNFFLSLNKNNISEEKKNTLINLSSLNNINNIKKSKKRHFNSQNQNSISYNPKKIKLNRIIKENKYMIKKPKFNSQISSLKYYLLYSEPGVAKKSLENIYDDLDKIDKKIDTFQEKEENKKNEYENRIKNNKQLINDNKMIINIPDYSNKKENLDNFLGLCGTYEKYNYEFSKIKNLFGTKINLFEKRNIIKNIIRNRELSNKTINNYSYPKKKIQLFFPSINNKNKNNKINKNKSYDKKKFGIKNNLSNNNELFFNNIEEIPEIKKYLSKKMTIDNNLILK